MGLERLFIERPEICALCGGLCCRGYPGMYLDPRRFLSIYPDAFDNLPDSFTKYKLTVKVCMGVPVPMPSYTEEGCIFLTDEGCLLGVDKRPCECLLLEPCEETLWEGEVLCKPVKGFSYVECFKNWRRFYENRFGGIPEALLELS